MPYAELVGWREFYNLEPWGLEVQDALQANAVSVLANVNRDAERRPEPYKLKDFLIFATADKPKVEPTVDGKTAAQWKLIFAAEATQAAQETKQVVKQPII